MSPTLRMASLLLLVATVACEKRNATSDLPSTGAGEDVDRAVAVEQGIRAHRESAESVLTAHQLTAEGFDSLMYTIAADSAKSAAYARALE